MSRAQGQLTLGGFARAGFLSLSEARASLLALGELAETDAATLLEAFALAGDPDAALARVTELVERHPGHYVKAALQGSSFLMLPRVLQWFSGNIGFHHIHHLSPRIPNYHLERCHASDPLFQQVRPMTLRSSLKSLWLRLWDEDSQRLVSFAHLRRLRHVRMS